MMGAWKFFVAKCSPLYKECVNGILPTQNMGGNHERTLFPDYGDLIFFFAKSFEFCSSTKNFAI